MIIFLWCSTQTRNAGYRVQHHPAAPFGDLVRPVQLNDLRMFCGDCGKAHFFVVICSRTSDMRRLHMSTCFPPRSWFNRYHPKRTRPFNCCNSVKCSNKCSTNCSNNFTWHYNKGPRCTCMCIPCHDLPFFSTQMWQADTSNATFVLPICSDNVS